MQKWFRVRSRRSRVYWIYNLWILYQALAEFTPKLACTNRLEQKIDNYSRHFLLMAAFANDDTFKEKNCVSLPEKCTADIHRRHLPRWYVFCFGTTARKAVLGKIFLVFILHVAPHCMLASRFGCPTGWGWTTGGESRQSFALTCHGGNSRQLDSKVSGLWFPGASRFCSVRWSV